MCGVSYKYSIKHFKKNTILMDTYKVLISNTSTSYSDVVLLKVLDIIVTNDLESNIHTPLLKMDRFS